MQRYSLKKLKIERRIKTSAKYITEIVSGKTKYDIDLSWEIGNRMQNMMNGNYYFSWDWFCDGLEEEEEEEGKW